MAAGAYHAIVACPPERLGAALLLAACGGCTAFGVLAWRIETHKRHILCAAGRNMFLAASLPRRTDEETLAAVGEICDRQRRGARAGRRDR